MENVIFTQLSIPEIRQIFRQELEGYFANKKQDSPLPKDSRFTIDELEAYSGIKKNTLYGMVSRGEIPVSKPGRRLIFVKSKIDQWLEDNRKKTADEIRAEAEEFLSHQK